MDQLEHKTLSTKPLDLTYSYYLSPNFHEKIKDNPDTPALLFCHGYPDDACESDELVFDHRFHADTSSEKICGQAQYRIF